MKQIFRISYRIGRETGARVLAAESADRAIDTVVSDFHDSTVRIVRVSQQCEGETRATIAGMGGRRCQRFTNDASGRCAAHQRRAR